MRASTVPDAGSLLQTGASLLWLVQAGLLAWALQGLLRGGGLPAVQISAAGVLLVGLARAACDAWGARQAFRAARARLSGLRAQVALALAARSPLDRARPASGLAASVMAEQAEAVVPYLTRYQTARMRATVVPPVILLAVLPLSWVAALVLLLAAPLIPLFMALVGWRAKAASEAQMVEMGGMNAFLLDRLRGLATLRALAAVDATALRLRDAAHALKQRTMAVLRIAFLSSAVLELFSALGVAMVAVYIGFHLLGPFDFGAWGRRLTLGQGFFVLLLTPAFFEPLRELASVWHDRAAGEAALGALNRLAAQGIVLPGAVGPQQNPDRLAGKPARSTSAVEIQGLRLTHPGANHPVFEGYDLHVAPGEHLVIAGASGAGKSTLLALIAGLLPAQGGSIVIDGVPLSEDTAMALRTRMAWIGQKPHIFAGTVQANVALSRAPASAAAVAAALRFAALDGVAQARPGVGLGEGGVGLSGGEAVRLALARAAVDPAVDLLLADEPTAHLDAATAAQVADALLQLAVGKTLIVATHDPVLAARVGRAGRVIQLGAARETPA
ncbi:thiol reductant ABC exporter subunit CydD [Polaromonas sp. C04]|uniref:thiol reductant ABC exporter subunit CydD n=1 Tax=Polaromonas sp. C04 TaxID=1945857 RepID=UPI0009D231EF|nr:thiol reductant ABC exporter subunit CydD [Polaromonas sp. C04]OOG51620.1 thiol reductant ABC exporter subunit CydD [Polaromonas sp. C04]